MEPSKIEKSARLPHPVRLTEQVWPEGTVPLVTIRCVTYNHVNFIREAIEGFLMQKTTFPVQILIHDDASSDGTTEIVQDYEKKHPRLITSIIQKENQYSRGIKPGRIVRPLIRGQYIAFCEGDDYWTDPNKLELQVGFLENNKEYVLTYHDVVVKTGDKPKYNPVHVPEIFKRDATKNDLIAGRFWPKSLTLCYRNVIRELPAEMAKVLNGDTFLVSLLGHFGKGKWLGKEIKPGVYRTHENSIWSSLSRDERSIALINTYFWLSVYYRRVKLLKYSENWYQHMCAVINDVGESLSPHLGLTYSESVNNRWSLYRYRKTFKTLLATMLNKLAMLIRGSAPKP